MGMTAYMGVFFMMVVLGLVAIVATIVLGVAYLAKKSDKGTHFRLNGWVATIFISLWTVFFLMFTIVGTVEPVYKFEEEKVIQVAAPQIEKTVVTIKELESLEAGMSQAEVTKVIGEDGEFLYESEDHVGGIVSYKWQNLPVGFAIVNFEKNENGKLYFYNYYVNGIIE